MACTEDAIGNEDTKSLSISTDEEYKKDVVGRLEVLVSQTDDFSDNGCISEIRILLAMRLPEGTEEDLILPLRAKLWSIMLLGLRPEDLNSQHNLMSSSLHGRTWASDHAEGLMHFPKDDQRVLAADIKRTRQAYPMFKKDEVMQVVSQVLERYCVGHGIRYKQGQNELIAPFVMLEDPPLPLPVLGLLFESFMSRFVSRWYVDDEVEALLVSYRVFRVLLFYVDPGLAGKLDDCDLIPELYATAWLITLFSRNLTLEMVARLWDVYIAVNDPALVFFLLAALLVRNREKLMKVDQAHMMPETVQGITVHDKQDLEELVVQAREMLRKIPGTFLRTVRSCCSDHGNTPLDTSRSLFCESVRCASIGPGELLERMDSRSVVVDDNGEAENDSPCPMRPGPLTTVALDIRPAREYANSGVGHLGKSVRLDPSLLKMDLVLEKWMQHFDGTRGTHVCLIDSIWPSPASEENASSRGQGRSKQGAPQSKKESTRIVLDPLWRRLLLGEGEEDWATMADQRTGEDCDRGGGGGGGRSASPHEEAPNGGSSSGGDRGFGAAKVLADKLHARGFPYVSILEGGMEGIIKHLNDEGIPLEPTVINHDPEACKLWREGYGTRQGTTGGGGNTPLANKRRAGDPFDCRGGERDHSASVISMRTDKEPWMMRRDSGSVKGAGKGWLGAKAAATGGEGGLRLGVFEKLARIREGVHKGVENVARTGAWAVEKGAEGVGSAAISGARSVYDAVMEDLSETTDVDPLNGSENGPSRNGNGGRLVAASRADVLGLDHGSQLVGAVARTVARTGSYAAEQGANGVGAVARSGAWAVREGAQIFLPIPPSQRNTPAGGTLSHEHTQSNGGGGQVSTQGGEGVERSEVERLVPGRRLAENRDSDRDVLLTALETAEAKGHTKVAKTLRKRLGLPPADRKNSSDGQLREASAEEEEDKEIWASVADLA